MKKLLLATALVLSATSAAFAQMAYPPGYGAPDGLYDYAPAYSYYGPAAPYGYYDYDYAPRWGTNPSQRGGPGPRVGAGSGAGVGSQR